MTVKELMTLLQDVPEDAVIVSGPGLDVEIQAVQFHPEGRYITYNTDSCREGVASSCWDVVYGSPMLILLDVDL